ncbi:hypothetical protein BSKO_09856 [Bryopsis sp. KO-2023]|nr:hypothetical protein BSKO_09856 [Bryopsis sp. KO-2023]
MAARSLSFQTSTISAWPPLIRIGKNHPLPVLRAFQKQTQYKMPAEISIKRTVSGEEQAIQSFVISVFDEFVGPDISQEGLDSFHYFMSLENMAERSKGNIQLAARTADGILVGVAEGRDNSHLTLLFVDKEFHGQGIGRRLFNEFIRIVKENDPSVEKITLNSSLFAFEIYRKMGFVQTAPEFKKVGIRCIPMELQL